MCVRVLRELLATKHIYTIGHDLLPLRNVCTICERSRQMSIHATVLPGAKALQHLSAVWVHMEVLAICHVEIRLWLYICLSPGLNLISRLTVCSVISLKADATVLHDLS